MDNLVIRKLFAPDISLDFITTLESLSPVNPDAVAIDFGEILRERFRTGIDTFIAILDNKIVGTASLVYERKFTWGGAVVAHVEDVAVHKDHKGNGIGSALMSHVIEQAKAAKCRKIVLDCSDGNVDFYERCGFRQNEVSMRLDLK